MIYRLSAYFISFLFCASVSVAQDTLLLTNGKYKELKGKVVFYDYEEVFYQTKTQKEAMETALTLLEEEENAKRASAAWKAKKAKAMEKMALKRERSLGLLKEKKARFEEQLKVRSEESVDEAAFERWKSKQEAGIKSIAQQLSLDTMLQTQYGEEAYERAQSRIRKRYTKRVPRQLVFSILKEEGEEQVIYSADTLGLLADGDYEKEYGVNDMRLYIKGRQDGRKHGFRDAYIGAATGLVSGLLFTYFWDVFYAPIPPAIGVAALAARNNFKPNKKLQLDRSLLESEAYMDGYIQSAKGRKILAFTIGAVGGLGVGIGAAIVTTPLLQ